MTIHQCSPANLRSCSISAGAESSPVPPLQSTQRNASHSEDSRYAQERAAKLGLIDGTSLSRFSFEVSALKQRRINGLDSRSPRSVVSRTRCSTRLSHSPTKVSPLHSAARYITRPVLGKSGNLGPLGPSSCENSPAAAFADETHLESCVSGRGFEVRVAYLLQQEISRHPVGLE